MVGIDAIAVTQNGETQYYIAFLTSEEIADSDKITYLMTQNPKHKTDKSIGVDSTIKDAEEAYGKVKVSYSTENESREYVSFPNADSQLTDIQFRPNSFDLKGFAGIYANFQGGLN